MKKTICDICGEDALDYEFILPKFEEYVAYYRGEPLAFSSISPSISKMNLCNECCSKIAGYIYDMSK